MGAAGVGGEEADAFTTSDVLALKRSSALTVTDVVAIGNVASVAPAGTVTLAGTLAAAFDVNNCTAAPPEGAALRSVTVPWTMCRR